MYSLLTGIAVFVVTAIVFWYCLPRGGKLHRFTNTELEPYIGVAFCAAVALSITLILSGTINLMDNP